MKYNYSEFINNYSDIYCGIYLIKNKVDDKIYIGESKNIFKRWRGHIKKSRSKHQYALNKDILNLGVDNFEFEVLYLCDEKDLKYFEYGFLKKYRFYNNLYNKNIQNSIAIMSEIDISTIIYYLMCTNKDYKEISVIFDSSEENIRKINTGLFFKHTLIEYPIRDKNTVSKIKKIKQNTNNIENNYNNTYLKCINCGKKVSKKSVKFCLKCAKEKQSLNILPKEQLIDMLNNFPFTVVGDYCGVTDNAIKRWCDKHEISRYAKDYNTDIKIKYSNKVKIENNKRIDFSYKQKKTGKFNSITGELIETYSSAKIPVEIYGKMFIKHYLNIRTQHMAIFGNTYN